MASSSTNRQKSSVQPGDRTDGQSKSTGLVKNSSPTASRSADSFTKLKLLLGTVLLLFAALFAASRIFRMAAFSEAQVTDALNAAPVNVLTLEQVESYEEVRTYSGTVAALRSSQLGFGRSGEVVQMSVGVGDLVTAGTPIATLDTASLTASRQELLAKRAQAVASLDEMLAGPRAETIAAAQASAESLRAQLNLAQEVGKRRQSLYEAGAISKEELDEALSEAAALQATWSEAISQVDELQAGTRSEQINAQNARIQELDASIARIDTDLNKSVLKAPFDGTIAVRSVDEGTVVNSGQTIVELVEDDKLEAQIGVPVSEAGSLRTGQQKTVTIEQKDYSATITAVSPTLDSATRTVTVVLALNANDNAGSRVSPGQVAQIELAETINSSGFWLPTTALVGGSSGLWSCYALGPPEGGPDEDIAVERPAFSVEQREVEILFTDSDRTLVRGTLSEGDRVIVNGNHRLVPGQLVHPVQP